MTFVYQTAPKMGAAGRVLASEPYIVRLCPTAFKNDYTFLKHNTMVDGLFIYAIT